MKASRPTSTRSSTKNWEEETQNSQQPPKTTIYFEKEYLLEALYDANQALYYDYCHKGALYLKYCICRYVNENNLMKKLIYVNKIIK